jgi:dTDP-4-dehydrorhamnose reductase
VKILLFGCNGQLGWELQRSLAPLGDVIALGSHDAEHCGDFRDPEGIARTIAGVKPGAIVNAAAHTAVDRAESEADLAAQVNTFTPEVIARAAEALGIPMVHYSTDYVFDGSGTQPWREDDLPAPLNVYGKTKLEGEQRIVRACSRHLILRTSWVYAARGGNFAKTMLRLAGEREQLKVIDDQIGAPTGADLLADVSAHALKALLAHPGKAGVYHVAAAGETSWNGYARFVVEQAMRAGKVLKAAPDQVLAVPTSAFPTAARRPQNSRMDTTRFRATFGLELPRWEQGVARMLQEIF